MDYHIVFSPKLDINPEDFADAWNEIPECREAAEARLSETRRFDLNLTAGVVTVLLGMVGSASYELIKTLIERVLERKGVSNPNIEQQGRSASGALVTVTTVEEK
jgi:hypothetical protein